MDSFNQHQTQIIAISVDTPEEARQFKESLELPFMVVSDEARDSICAYGASDTAEKNGKIIAKVATVIVDQQQNVIYKYVGTHWSDRPTEEKMIEVLASIGEN